MVIYGEYKSCYLFLVLSLNLPAVHLGLHTVLLGQKKKSHFTKIPVANGNAG